MPMVGSMANFMGYDDFLNDQWKVTIYSNCTDALTLQEEALHSVWDISHGHKNQLDTHRFT